MKLDIKLFNTLPNKKDSFWQVVVLPTASILRGLNPRDPYTAVNIEWLFWSLTFIINANDKRGIFGA